jgi:hypothetical protein
MTRDDDVPVPMRDGIRLVADVIRPAAPGPFPVLIAASPYPRQIQDLGAPFGFIEAGASDFFVPRGYVHVIANLRGTSGSAGVFGFFDAQERRDLYDLVEWAAEQPWSDGNVERVYVPAETEPPGDDADPEETAAFLGSMLQATAMDITAACRARRAGRRREIDLHRGALRLTDQALAELRGHIEQLAARFADPGADGTWTRVVLALVDLQDRPDADPSPGSPA